MDCLGLMAQRCMQTAPLSMSDIKYRVQINTVVDLAGFSSHSTTTFLDSRSGRIGRLSEFPDSHGLTRSEITMPLSMT
jgi:hypothetical protein